MRARALAVIIVGLLAPVGGAHAAAKETVLNVFGGTNGDNPDSGVVADKDGNLYGVTLYGGLDTKCPAKTYGTGSQSLTIPGGCGVVFKLTKPAAGQTVWKETVLFKFPGGASGINPSGSLALDTAGNLYGGTKAGGLANGCPSYINATKIAAGCGVVYKLAQPAAGQTVWKETVLHTFHGTDGAAPLLVPLAVNAAGDEIIGVTIRGGPSATACPASSTYGDPAGCGLVFELRAVSAHVWQLLPLHNFTGGADGAAPGGALAGDAGDLYGTTSAGGGGAACPVGSGGEGLAGCGTVFKLTPAAVGIPWKETIIDKLAGGSHPATPFGGILFDSAGNLYSTSLAGGPGPDGIRAGTVFRLSPPAAGKTAWTETVLYSFTGTGGDKPQAGLLPGPGGTFYGTTDLGGTSFAGTIYQLSPPATGHTAWTQKVVYDFGANGFDPLSSLIKDSAGNLFGTTFSGRGSYSQGTVFEITP